MPSFYEFFAGGGMVRAGLGEKWTCLFANDIDAKKGASYAANWGSEHLRIQDVGTLAVSDLPGHADLAWASFPCQDLSVAGACAGLQGQRSGTFWPFWGLIQKLAEQGRAPSIIALENVCGALTSHQGEDFAAIGAALTAAGYRFGALVIDAVLFLPQSRPRLFIVAVRETSPRALAAMEPDPIWHPPNVRTAYEQLSRRCKAGWIWWRLPAPSRRKTRLADVLEDGAIWHSAAETSRLLSMMSVLHRKKVDAAQKTGRRVAGCVYRRTRQDGQRAEIRFDDVAGCLRTPAGGSSRQTIMFVEGEVIQSRLLSAREAARLMGLPDSYQLPQNYNTAYHLAGDGVAVPVVRYLTTHLLEPLLGVGTGQNVAA